MCIDNIINTIFYITMIVFYIWISIAIVCLSLGIVFMVSMGITP